jgi:hypothetical protein
VVVVKVRAAGEMVAGGWATAVEAMEVVGWEMVEVARVVVGWATAVEAMVAGGWAMAAMDLVDLEPNLLFLGSLAVWGMVAVAWVTGAWVTVAWATGAWAWVVGAWVTGA